MANEQGSSFWEFNSADQMMSYLVGKSYGENPAKKIDEIRVSKAEIAKAIMIQTEMNKNSNVLEIGPGCGFLSNKVAGAVNHLHCADISVSFLEFAKKECAAHRNISFHQIQNREFSFAAEKSMDVIYAYNVFIHLNLFDMYWYFREIARVLKVGGRFWFDIANADDLLKGPTDLFLEMAHLYKGYPSGLPNMVQWQSAEAVVSLARSFGLVPLWPMRFSAILIFTREAK